jgi:hypothetical protein
MVRINTYPSSYDRDSNRPSSPGRFLAADILKLILAEMALRFEIKCDEKPEESSWFGNSLLPGQNTVISVSPRHL